MDIINRNFLLALRTGAFNEFVSFEPMSIYKWRQLLLMSRHQGVYPIAVAGIRSHQYDQKSRVPQCIIKEIADGEKGDMQHNDISLSTIGEQGLSGSLAKKMEKINEEELHAIDTSTDTLHMLTLILGCSSVMLASDAYIGALIETGQYLRTKGDKVDFVKLERWLKELHMQGMATLIGSLIMDAFGFSLEELPFTDSYNDKAKSHLERTLLATIDSQGQEWHFKQNGFGLYRGNMSAIRHKMNRSAHFASVAPITALHDLGASIIKSLKEIEE